MPTKHDVQHIAAVILPLILIAGAARAEEARAYCARVVDDDQARPLPRSLAPAARRLFELSPDDPDTLVANETVWRCMGGRIWLCTFGANLACGKANISRNIQAVSRYCASNPDTNVPFSVTGHDTIYEWRCAKRKALAFRRVSSVDVRGFLADNWKALE